MRSVGVMECDGASVTDGDGDVWSKVVREMCVGAINPRGVREF